MVPLVGEMANVGAAKFLGYALGDDSVEFFVESYVAQVVPPTLDRRPQMLQHMGDAAAAPGKVQIEEGTEQCPTQAWTGYCSILPFQHSVVRPDLSQSCAGEELYRAAVEPGVHAVAVEYQTGIERGVSHTRARASAASPAAVWPMPSGRDISRPRIMGHVDTPRRLKR
jgi:hypothetical protein